MKYKNETPYHFHYEDCEVDVVLHGFSDSVAEKFLHLCVRAYERKTESRDSDAFLACGVGA